jgi:hypothetical protein
MNDKKLNLFVNTLKNNKEITFVLFNAFYIIKYQYRKYYINQFGIDTNYIYESITELFNNYLVYGSSLKENFDNIKIIN